MKLLISLFLAFIILSGATLVVFNDAIIEEKVPQFDELPDQVIANEVMLEKNQEVLEGVDISDEAVEQEKEKNMVDEDTQTSNSYDFSGQNLETGSIGEISTRGFDEEYPVFVETLKGCISGENRNESRKCADEYMRKYYETFSTEDALVMLQRGMDEDNKMLVMCHDMAHSIGRETLVKAVDVDVAFDMCDQTCHSGCYHGVMERVFIPEGSSAEHITEEDLREKTPTACTGYEGKPPRFKFQCLHGIGHAILFLLDNNLEKGLGICDLMTTHYDRSSCWGGVLMENVTSFDKNTRWIKASDPHYPCNAIDNKYQNDCYVMQTSIMFELGLSPSEIAQECRNAANSRLVCMQSLGRDVSSNSRSNPEYGINICTNLEEDEKLWCVIGVVYALMDLTWDGQFAFQFCDALSLDADRKRCYQDSIRYMHRSLGIERTSIENYCKTQSKNTSVCSEKLAEI